MGWRNQQTTTGQRCERPSVLFSGIPSFLEGLPLPLCLLLLFAGQWEVAVCVPFRSLFRFGLVGLVSEHVFVPVFVDLYPYGYFVPEFTQEPVAGG